MLTAQCYAPCHGLDVLRLSALVPEGVAIECLTPSGRALQGRPRDGASSSG